MPQDKSSPGANSQKEVRHLRPSLPGFDISECLGTGGYASVWLAWRKGALGFQAPMAVKVLNPEPSEDEAARRRFIAEARILAQLEHPNIVRVFDAGVAQDRPFYLMEFVRAVSLARLLTRQSRLLPLDGTLFIAIRVASALQAAHDATDWRGHGLGIVHRDVNPTNILIGPQGTVKLIDFGIAVSDIGPRETRVNVIKGNPRYLSPEQAFGIEVDFRSDVYSLALTLYETITGRAPLAAESQAKTLQLARQPEIARPSYLRPAIPARLDEAVMKALQRDPPKRYRSMGDFARALQGCLAELNPTMLPESLDLLLANAPLPVAMPPRAGTMPMGAEVKRQIDDDDTAVMHRNTVPHRDTIPGVDPMHLSPDDPDTEPTRRERPKRGDQESRDERRNDTRRDDARANDTRPDDTRPDDTRPDVRPIKG